MSTTEEPRETMDEEPSPEGYEDGYGRVLIIVAPGTVVSKPDYVDVVELNITDFLPIVVRR